MTSQPSVTVAARTTALLVVDMQNDFCHADGYYARAGRDISALAASVAPVSALLDRCRRAKVTIAFTRLVHDERRGAMEERHAIRPLRWTASGRRLLPGSWGADLVHELSPLDGEIVIDKAGYSAFDDTRLEAALRSRGVTTLILAGVVTYACVLATAFSAFDRGFDVLLATEAVGSWNTALGAGTGEIVDLLLGRAVTSDQIAIEPGPQR